MTSGRKNFFYCFAAVAAILLLFGLVELFKKSRQISTAVAARAATTSDAEFLASLTVADGWEIQFFAPPSLGLIAPRQLAAGGGWIFAGSADNKVYALRDSDNDGVADDVRIIAEEMDLRHGVAYHRGNLYISSPSTIYVIQNIAAQLNSGDKINPQVLIRGLIDSTWHGMRHIAIREEKSPDGNNTKTWLYVSLGAPCNVCEPQADELYGVIRRYALPNNIHNTNGDAPADVLALDAKSGEVAVRGVRNSVGYDFHPHTGDLWFTDNGRDWLGDDLPNDELNRASKIGEHFGFPYCHQGDFSDPEYGELKPCADFQPPALNTGTHVANLGMRFDAEGKNIYIALHGSWNRSVKSGYTVQRAAINNDNTVTDYAPFISGWLHANQDVSGRPVDILWDGNDMFISDDFSNAIYRVYRVQQKEST